MLSQLAQLEEVIRPVITSFAINPDKFFYGNTVLAYTTALVFFITLLVVFKAIKFLILRRLDKLADKTKTDIDNAVIEIFRSLHPPFYSFLAFYIALQGLSISGFMESAIDVILIIWVVYQVIVGSQIFIAHLIERKLTREEDATTRSALQVMGRMLRGVLWGVGFLLVFSNLGIDISSLLAGVGIGGIAIAFALQNILSDLFSSFAIYFDKPFKVGDFVIVGSHMGTVEKIGIKTTRLRALQGEEIVISNRELTSTRVQNFKKMTERRVVLSLGVVYQTGLPKLKTIPKTLEEIIKSVKGARFDRAHFNAFDNSALGFEAVYYAETPDYTKYMDIQQEINFKIAEAFEKEKIEFAYPTQTLYVHSEK